jgi:ABC-type glycerol-3-phosphate transport system substrate-binding protein
MSTCKTKCLALAIVLAMALATACGAPAGNNAPASEAPATTRDAPAAATGDDDGAASGGAQPNDALEPITLTIQGNVGGTKYMENGVMENPVALYIRENTGISIDLTMLPDSGDSQDKLNAMIAANDLPDVFCLNGGEAQFNNLLRGQLIYELDGLVAEHAPNMNADNNALAMMAGIRLEAPDGKLYKIGMNKGYWDSAGMGPQRGYYIRWDLYKELGYPQIATTDELCDVLAQMQEMEPANKSDQKTYAAAAWNNGITDSVTAPQALMMGFAAGPNNVLAVDIDTKQILETSPLEDASSYIWEGLKWANKLSRLGAFDPDSFTQTYQNYMDKSNAGNYMMSVLTWSAGGANTAFISDGTPEKQLICLPSKDFGYKNVNLFDNMVKGERHWAIAKSCETPERAVQLLDFMSTFEFSRIAHDGPQGTNWDVVDGKAAITNHDFIGMTEDQGIENSLSTGARVFRLFTGYASATANPADGQSVDLLSDATPLSDMHKDFLARYGKDSMNEVYMDGMGTYTSSTLVSWGALTDDLKTYESNLRDYLNQSYVACILAADDAAFEAERDKLIAGLDAYRIDEIFQCYYDNAMKTAEQTQAIYDLLEG